VAPKYRLDLTRTIAMGHSAGGHLAMWLAGRSRIEKGSELYPADPIRLAGVVNLDGPPDLIRMREIELKACGAPVITQLMGGTPQEQPERYRAGSPAALLPLGTPQELFMTAFAREIGSYVENAKGKGDRVNLTAFDRPAGHFDVIDPKSAAWPVILEKTLALLR
jgi:acetyl esterase/lipase